MDVLEWKLNIIFLLLVGLGFWLRAQGKKTAEIVARLEELRKLSEALAGRQTATKIL